MITGWKPYLSGSLPAAAPADRLRIESRIGFRLPDDYWAMASVHQGEIPVPDRFPFPGHAVPESVGVLLTVLDPEGEPDPQEEDPADRFSYSLEVCYDGLAGYYPPQIVPFSDDTGGNYLAFDFRTPGPAVVFVDHNVAGDDGLTAIASDFAALLDLLTERARD